MKISSIPFVNELDRLRKQITIWLCCVSFCWRSPIARYNIVDSLFVICFLADDSAGCFFNFCSSSAISFASFCYYCCCCLLLASLLSFAWWCYVVLWLVVETTNTSTSVFFFILYLISIRKKMNEGDSMLNGTKRYNWFENSIHDEQRQRFDGWWCWWCE